MIEKLEPLFVIYGDKEEVASKLVNKINELVETINQLEKKIENENKH